jgi:hypothetical protein
MGTAAVNGSEKKTISLAKVKLSFATNYLQRVIGVAFPDTLGISPSELLDLGLKKRSIPPLPVLLALRSEFGRPVYPVDDAELVVVFARGQAT